MRSWYTYNSIQLCTFFFIIIPPQVTVSPPRPRRRSWSATPASCREGEARRVCAPSMISCQSAWDSGRTQVHYILWLNSRNVLGASKTFSLRLDLTTVLDLKGYIQASTKTRISNGDVGSKVQMYFQNAFFFVRRIQEKRRHDARTWDGELHVPVRWRKYIL